MRKLDSPNFDEIQPRGVSVPGTSKLDHFQPIEPICLKISILWAPFIPFLIVPECVACDVVPFPSSPLLSPSLPLRKIRPLLKIIASRWAKPFPRLIGHLIRRQPDASSVQLLSYLNRMVPLSLTGRLGERARAWFCNILHWFRKHINISVRNWTLEVSWSSSPEPW